MLASAWRVGWQLFVVLLGIAALALLAWMRDALPAGLAMSLAGVLLAAAVATLAGLAAPPPLVRAMWWGACVGGLVNVGVAAVHLFAPALADGVWVAVTSHGSRAAGNVRQPNLLATLSLIAACAVPVLFAHRHRVLAWAAFACLVASVTWTHSRTGALGVLVLAAWGLLDGRLTPWQRKLLASGPGWYALVWGVTWWWSQRSQTGFAGTERLAQTDWTSSRFAIWRDALALVADQPLWGVGLGRFNLAWTTSAFPARPTEFFDHTHNASLQWAVELGVPLALLITTLLAVALWRAVSAAFGLGRASSASASAHPTPAPTSLDARAASVALLVVTLHSQLEYPLWYAHFLLPTAFLWGVALGHAGSWRRDVRAVASARSDVAKNATPWVVAFGGCAMVVASLAAFVDYQRVVAIYEPRGTARATPLADRIAKGRLSWLYAHHADYALATTATQPSRVMDAFDRSKLYLLDARLLQAWAVALAERGELDAARHVAARLKEFRHASSADFFAVCTDAKVAPSFEALRAASPAFGFQCEAPGKTLPWTALR